MILSTAGMICLRWVSLGMTPGQIALLEGKSVTEIKCNLDQALASLGAKSMEEALKTLGLPESR